jgi:hypothetical protein
MAHFADMTRCAANARAKKQALDRGLSRSARVP